MTIAKRQLRGGRPTKFTPQITDRICERLMDGDSLRRICADRNMPDKSQVFRWLSQNEAFRDQYARARLRPKP